MEHRERRVHSPDSGFDDASGPKVPSALARRRDGAGSDDEALSIRCETCECPWHPAPQETHVKRIRPPRWGLVLALCLLHPLAGPAAEPEDTETAQTMAELVGNLEYLLPLSFDSERFSSPAEREAIRSHLRLLVDQSARLETHATAHGAAFGSLSRSFAKDARLIDERYREGKPDEARFLLHELTDACVACHSRLPDAASRPLGRRLAESPEVAALPLDERVRIEAATRQFDRALGSYEELFASDRLTPQDLDLGGYLDTYVELCLRVRRDAARPRRALEQLAARKDATRAEREVLTAWVASLRELEKRERLGDPVAEGAALLALAKDRSRYPDDRRALVYYVAASGELHRALAEPELSPVRTAQAYYGLGLVESRVGRAFWLSQTEDLLEAAIRVDPGGPWAEPSWQLLEEFLASGYTGSAGGELPADVQARLGELRALIDAAHPS
jgi:hypothetical protein